MFSSERAAINLRKRLQEAGHLRLSVAQYAFYLSVTPHTLEYRVKWCVHSPGRFGNYQIYRGGKFRSVREVASLGSLRTFQFLPVVSITRSEYRHFVDGPKFNERSISQDGFTYRDTVPV
jgi:hypothetical protein